MSAETEIAASRYLYGRDDGLAWQTLPAKAYVATWDVNVYNGNARRAGRPPYSRSSFTPVLGYDVRADGPKPMAGPGASRRFPPGPATDSASAATALATGFKTDSGNIAWLPGDPPDGRLDDDRRGVPGQDRGRDRDRQHGPVRPRDPGRLRQPQHQPQRLLHRAQRLQGTGHRRRDHPADEARRRHRRRIAASRQPRLRHEKGLHLGVPLSHPPNLPGIRPCRAEARPGRRQGHRRGRGGGRP